ncbi:MAG: protein kinase [Planctomycetes bacterium]|nr:protein kinase [Planctomycetota bacterium]
MEQEIDLFHEALERDPAERVAFLTARHAHDPALLQRLLKLLAAHERAESDGEARLAPGVPPIRPIEAVEAIEPTPEFIGPYRVLERIGEGGMGVVYAAEQQKPFRRRVAIKVVKLGMDTREVLARFQAERQALAMLDHPGVAKALDAGATDRGRPYFVMELVKGLSLVDYCQRNKLSIPDRLRLFVEVCAAIQHAHHKGIIHRDLKPSNVLVAMREGIAVPKVIDFGVAKATASRLTEHTLFTEQGRLIGTPEYMSPEQAEMSGLDVDTRTDVYSLGVILYELLTGGPPFDSKQLRSGGYSEILRIIREVHPPRPSTRLLERGRATAAAQLDGYRQARQVRGELDWIVMRAIEKDRTRRYGTASALGEDVERYLTDRPVLARPPGVVYTLRKFVKRHRGAAALVAVLMFSTLIGICGLLIGLFRAHAAEVLATRRADHAQATAGFLERMFFQADPEYGGGDTTLVEAMERAGQLIEDELRPFPEVEASVRESLGVAYRRRSMFVEAAPHLWRSLEIRRAVFGDQDLATARSLIALADLRLEYEGNVDAARDLIDRAAECFRVHGITGTLAEAWLQLDVGITDTIADRLGAAERAFETCRRLLAESRGEQHRDVSRPVRGLATVALARGELEQAEGLARQAAALSSDEQSTYIGGRARLVLAQILIEMGDVEAAARQLAEADHRFRRTVGNRHIRIAECDTVHSALALRRGDFAAAAEAAARCEEMRRGMLYEDHWQILEARLLRQLAVLAAEPDQDDLALAAAELVEIEQQAGRRLGEDHPFTIRAVAACSQCAAARGAAEEHAALEQRQARLQQSRTERLQAQSAR